MYCVQYNACAYSSVTVRYITCGSCNKDDGCQPYKSHDLEGLEGCGLDLNLQNKQRETKEQEKYEEYEEYEEQSSQSRVVVNSMNTD